jgi:DNA adenine methylase
MVSPTPGRPAAYLGGKRNLAKRLCAMIADTPLRTYIEPFVGMGGVFLRRATPAPVEVINDLSGDVANLFRIIRRHYEPFVDELRWLIASRAEVERQRALDPLLLTDIERAVRFLYLQRLAFGGRVERRTFGVRRDQDSRFNLGRLRGELKALRDRLATVTIEQLDYAAVLRRYDGTDALFFLDPPYDGTEGYGIAFGPDQYQAMARQLAGIAGQFILSINDTPFIRETFAGFRIDEVLTTWTVSSASSGRAMKVTELIIRSPAR